MRRVLLIMLGLLMSFEFFAQNFVDYSNPKEYEIADISVTGVKYLSRDALIMLSGLSIGQKITIPGSEISDAIQKLWDQGLFSDVKIEVTKIEGNKVYLNFYLQEQPRLLNLYFRGINKTQQDDLRDELDLKRGKKVTKSLLNEAEKKIKDYYAKKGFPFVSVSFKMVDDTMYQNTVNLYITIDKNRKVKIHDIVVRGNENVPTRKILGWMKETKKRRVYRFWKPSRYIEDKFEEDKNNIIKKYNELGYRDARIIEDSVYTYDDKYLNVYLKIHEGNKYYFRDITWVGNTKYSSDVLSKALDIKKGEPYDEARLENRLQNDENAVANLYMDDGYLFFRAIPREAKIENDSVDVEIMIYEGQQAKINNIEIKGNTRTNDHVIRREIRTLPGELFSKTDLIRSVRELANLGFFDPEQLTPTPIPDQANGTVDILYKVVEKSSDMFEMSGGYGALGFIGRLSLKFNNFSLRNLTNLDKWAPLPVGDGQKLTLSAQTNGSYYQMYSFSFMDPWFGGKKPNSFSVSLYYNKITNGISREQAASSLYLEHQEMTMLGASVGLGKRLKWPDDFFLLSTTLSFDRYRIDGYRVYIDAPDGIYNMLSLSTTFGRNSVDNPIYPRHGSDLSFTVKATPPYSLFTGKTSYDVADTLSMSWVELYKISLKGKWYQPIAGDLVFAPRFEYGFVGYYNKSMGYSPFDGYIMGGDFMGYYTYGKEFVTMRGYAPQSLTPEQGVAHAYAKYTMEVRYPLLKKETAYVYVLSFLEAGNAWYDLNEFNPFSLRRSGGVGIRLFLPMIGLVGIDFAYGLDPVPGNPSSGGYHYHFVMGQQL